MTEAIGSKGAEEAVEQAIRDLIDAYGLTGHGILTDCVIIVVQENMDAQDEAEDTFLVSPLMPRALPLYRVLGMLEHASTRVRARILASDRDDDERLRIPRADSCSTFRMASRSGAAR